jgi:chitinase
MRQMVAARRLVGLVCAWLVVLTMALSSTTRADHTTVFAAYFESWISEDRGGFDADLVNIPASVTIVMLAFMKPDAQYLGNLQLAGTGLEFKYSGSVLRDSITELRKRNPGVKIYISVGGETYANWSKLNAQAIARFVQDFGLNGVDVDFEPSDPGCVQTDTSISCKTDALLGQSVTELRSNLPRAVKISLTCGATGAFGEGKWKDSNPTGGPDYGTMVQFLSSPDARAIDMLNLMAYDAGTRYDPLEGLDAFQHYYSGPIVLGFTPPPEAWGGHAYTKREVTELLSAAMARGAAGAMLFSLRKENRRGTFVPFVSVIAEVLEQHRK